MTDLLESLNAPQKEAVLYFDGPLLVLAGAGPGKTRVLVHKIAHMVAHNMVSAENILAVTFTNKAAGEMKERIAKLCGAAKFPWMGTFHSICVRILRISGTQIGIPNTFTIYDRDDQLGVVKDILKQQKVDDDATPSAVLSTISRAKSRLQTPQAFKDSVDSLNDELAAGVYSEYQKRLEANGALDFDDLLMKTVNLFKEVPEVLERYRRQFQYTLIDEFQDVNYAQHVLVQLITQGSGKVTAVGDDDQSIYAFRGADVGLILRFDKDYPNAKIIKLEQNYRSTGTILDLGNQVIRQNLRRHDKTLWTESPAGDKPTFRRVWDGYAEARSVVREIRRHYREWRRPWGDFAIMYRANAQSRPFEEALIREGIPYKLVGGTRFFERKEIKDLMAYLWVVVNPTDELNLKRILNVPPRGIGVATLHRLEEGAVRERKTFYELLKDPSRCGDLTPRTLAALREVVGLLERMQVESATAGVCDILKKIIDSTGYDDFLDNDKTAEPKARLENIEELVNMAAEFQASAEDPSLRAFMIDKALVQDVDSLDDKEAAVTLMTLHAAKGLEFPIVFLAGLEDDTFPSARCRDNPEEMEEERRLCYVGITRAQERLYLTAASRRRVYGEETERIISTFIRDLPNGLIESQEDNSQEEDAMVSTPSYSGNYASGASIKSNRNSYGTTPGFRAPWGEGPRYINSGPRTAQTTRGSGARSNSPVLKVSPSAYKTGPTPYPAAPPAPPVEPVPPPFKEGDRVTHKVFGTGVVEKIERDVVQAEFPGHGTKKIVAAFLTKAAEEGGSSSS